MPRLLIPLSLLLTATAFAQSAQTITPPATRPATTQPLAAAATAPATRPAPPNSMTFDFRDAPVDAVLDALSENFGFTILRGPTPIPGRITVISRGRGGEGEAAKPLTAAQAIEVTNSLLLPLGYGLVEAPASAEGAPVYHVTTTDELKKGTPVGPVQPLGIPNNTGPLPAQPR